MFSVLSSACEYEYKFSCAFLIEIVYQYRIAKSVNYIRIEMY